MAKFFVPAGNKFASIDIPVSVVNLLSQLSDKYTVFLGAQFERQSDIIIFTSNSVHLVEIKDKQGIITVDEKDRWFVDGLPIVNRFAGIDENPPTQARNTAFALKQTLKQIYRRVNKNFDGKIFPYVLIPNANEATRSNLRQIKTGWVWILTALEELPTAILRRDQEAIATKNFAFTPSDIELIAQSMRMVPVEEVNGIKLSEVAPIEIQGIPRFSEHSQRSSPSEENKQHPMPRFSKSALFPLIGLATIFVCIGIVSFVIILTSFATLFKENLRNLGTFSMVTSTPIQSVRVVPTPSPKLTQTVSPTPTQRLIQTVSPTPTQRLIQTATFTPVATDSDSIRWSTNENGLVLTVNKIETTKGFKIWMTAVNNTSQKLSLPLYGYFFAVDNLGNQYEADPFSSTFPRDIAPGAIVSGYAQMKSPLNSKATHLTVTFTQVFGSLAIHSISIKNIPIR